MTAEKDEKTIYFTMKMPDWFINLEGEEKIKVVKRLAGDSPDEHTLSGQELLDLMSPPAE
jgi:hypothetical protein